MPTLRRARPAAAAFLSLALVLGAACHGRNDGSRDGYGGASMGAGGPGQPGPAAGQNTDTTMSPAGTPGPAPAGAPTTTTQAKAESAATKNAGAAKPQ